MAKPVIKVEGLGKQYHLGEVGTGTITHDLNRFWARLRGKEDPYSQIGQVNDRSKASDSDFVWSLKDINFEVNQGDVLGIIGKNGAGKSTLLKILSRITAPTTGNIKIKGRLASLLEVGTGMHPEMTARENIYLNGSIMGMRKHEITRKFDEIIDFAGCRMYVDTPVKRYSSGMRVRLGFAVAAFLEPEILVVDEVLAVGDAEFQKKAIGKMQDVASGEGRTVLFVSHNMASIQNLCSRLLVLDQGQVSFDGGVEDGIIKYLSKNTENSSLNILEREDRKGGQLFRFSDLFFSTFKGQRIASITTGQDVILNVLFNTKLLNRKVIIRLVLCDKATDNVVTFLNNNHTGDELFVDASEMHVKVDMKNCPLSVGEYYFNLRANIEGEFVDELEYAFSFSVEEGDFYNTGKLPNVRGGVFISHKWYV